MPEKIATRRPTPTPRKHNLQDKIRLVHGKIQRFYVGHFRKKYVARRLAIRKGECQRCGACCRLLIRCPYVKECQGEAQCRIYGKRPINCRIFPLNRRHLAERDLLLPEQPCGYYFED